MARTTINIPADILREIGKLRQRMPLLTQNSALFELARKGAAQAILEDIGDISELFLSLEKMVENAGESQHSTDFALKKVNHSVLQTNILLRRFIHEIHGEEGGRILAKAKTDLLNFKEKESE